MKLEAEESHLDPKPDGGHSVLQRAVPPELEVLLLEERTTDVEEQGATNRLNGRQDRYSY